MARSRHKTNSVFYPSLLVTVILIFIATALYFKALRITDLSLSIPILSFTPIFLILTSFVILRESPTIFGVIGIFLIVTGSFFLNLNKKRDHFLDSFRELFRSRGIIYMLIVAFLLSFAANYNKLVIQNSDTTFGSSVIFLLVGLLFLTTSVVKKYEIKAVYKKNLCKLLLVGLVSALAEITINMALVMQIVPYVISLRRLSILFGVFYGGLLFRERNISQRSLAALIMLIGIIIIALS